jgi:hypothetical protein
MMTKKELLLTAHLLELAGDKFGGHGRTDYQMSESPCGMTPDEVVDLDRRLNAVLGDPKDHDPEQCDWQDNWCLMLYMAYRIKEET